MSEYLSKEEIKRWRSSLEKITLEEYAARLGKKIAEDKPTNDLADIVLHGQPVVSSYDDEWSQPKTERITSMAERAFAREKEIAPSPFSISKLKLSIDDFGDTSSNDKQKTSPKAAKSGSDKKQKKSPANTVKAKEVKPAKQTIKETAKKQQVVETKKAAQKTPAAAKAVKEVMEAKPTGDKLRDEVRVVFKKVLTDREQKVFDYFAEHQNEVVYAKDLAVLLNLPRDYVYKYIKNLRAKIEGEKLENADKGGFILHA